MNYLKRALNIADDKNKEKPEQLLETLTAEGVAKFINSEKCKHIVTMAGAGISTCKIIYFLSMIVNAILRLG